MSDQPPSYNEKNQPYNQPGYNPQPVQQQQEYHQPQPQEQPIQEQQPQQSSQNQYKQPQQQGQGQGQGQGQNQPYVVVQHGNIPPEPKKFGGCAKFGLYLLCFIFPPISTLIVSPKGSDTIINILLLFLVGIGSIIHGIYIVYKYTSGEGSYDAWEEKYGKRKPTTV